MKKVLPLVALLSLTACGISYSDGVRVGVVTKFSYRGILCKSWEGEMNLGGMRQDSHTNSEGHTSYSTVPNIWEFTVSKQEHVDQIQRAMDSGTPIKLSYTQTLLNNPCSTSTGYFITKVQ